MIVFDLNCTEGHRFEGWFKSRDDFADQRTAGIIECPVCGSSQVQKGFSAPNLGKGHRHGQGDGQGGTRTPSQAVAEFEAGESQSMNAPALPPKLEAELKTVFAKIRDHVESTCDYVGDRFAEEARRMHYGEAEERGIYGEASLDETAELMEEGIELMPLPGNGPRREDA